MVYLGMKVADAVVKIHDSNQQYPIYSAIIAISKSRKKPQRNMRNKEYDTLAFPISYLESRQKHAYKVSKSTSKYCITEQPNFLKYE